MEPSAAPRELETIMRFNIVAQSLCLAGILVSANAARASERSPVNCCAPPRCAATALRSAGYRDMLTRFPLRQIATDKQASLGAETSYRDASRRHPPARSEPGSIAARPRYVLRAMIACS
jgi:hypothetical protein